MNKSIKYFLALSLIIACIFCLAACGDKTPELASISATIDGEYKVYLYDELDTSKITVTAKYSDEKEETIPASELKFGDFDTTKAGEKELKISYKEKSTTLKINVSDTNKVKVDGFKPTFLKDGKASYWKVRLSNGQVKYFSDENLQNEVTELDLVLPKYAVKNAAITTNPTQTAKGVITITTTTNETLKIYLPTLNEDDPWGYSKISKASWTQDNVYAYKLKLDDLVTDCWENSSYERESDEYRIDGAQVEAIKSSLENLEILTEAKAPALSTKLVIEKVGSIKLQDEHTSRVMFTGKLLYGKIDRSFPANFFSIYFKNEKVPFSEKFRCQSIEFNPETNEYTFVTNFYTDLDNAPLGTEGIQCSPNSSGSHTGLLVKPGDEIISNQRQKFNLQINTLTEGKTLAKGDILSINDFPCKIVNIKDATNNKDLEKITEITTSVIYAEMEILHDLEIDYFSADNYTIRTGQVVEVYKYKDENSTVLATGKISSVKSRIKADIKVNGSTEIAVGKTIEDLVSGDMKVSNLTNFNEINKIGIATIISVPSAANEENVYKDVILEIDTTSDSANIPQKDDNFFSREYLDFLNGCLSPGETIKVYNTFDDVELIITITEYNL